MTRVCGLLLAALCALGADKGPANAPVVVMAFTDFGSPQAARAGPVLEEIFRQYPGRVRLIFKHAPFSQAFLAHEAVLAAGEQGKFWEMHDLVLASPNDLGLDRLKRLAAQLGLDTGAFEAALREHRHLAAVERDWAEARALGLQAAPIYFVNGKAFQGVPSAGAFRAVVNQVLNLPAQVMTKGAPRRGSASAPVTLVEFSDFQCGFCARALATVRQLMQEYPGKVQWVFKHFPLDFHRDAPLAHEAALAAGAQGKFWEMHDLLFERKTLTREAYLKMAGELGLDTARFAKDLDAGRFRAVVEQDRREGAELGVEGTPTFFINGRTLVGAQPIDAFRKLIEAELTGVASR